MGCLIDPENPKDESRSRKTDQDRFQAEWMKLMFSTQHQRNQCRLADVYDWSPYAMRRAAF